MLRYYLTRKGDKLLSLLREQFQETFSDVNTAGDFEGEVYRDSVGYRVDILDNLDRLGYIERDDDLFRRAVYQPYFRELTKAGYIKLEKF